MVFCTKMENSRQHFDLLTRIQPKLKLGQTIEVFSCASNPKKSRSPAHANRHLAAVDFPCCWSRARVKIMNRNFQPEKMRDDVGSRIFGLALVPGGFISRRSAVMSTACEEYQN